MEIRTLNLYGLYIFIVDVTNQICEVLFGVFLSNNRLHIWIEYVNFLLNFPKFVSKLLNLFSHMVLVINGSPVKLLKHFLYVFPVLLNQSILLWRTCFVITCIYLFESVLTWGWNLLFPILIYFYF